MITQVSTLRGRAAVLAATGHHPYVRHTVAPDEETVGYRLADTVIWTTNGPHGPIGQAYGDADLAIDLIARAPEFDGLNRLNLPRAAGQPAGRPAGWDGADWDFLWAAAPPPAHPDEARVVPLTDADHDDLAALIDAAYPSSTARPGARGIVGWYGVRDGDRLIALGADVSRGDVGFMAGLTVAPDQRGRGLGAALTTAMTRRLFDRYARVALGVWTDNVAAARLYRRLGFTGSLARTTVRRG